MSEFFISLEFQNSKLSTQNAYLLQEISGPTSSKSTRPFRYVLSRQNVPIDGSNFFVNIRRTHNFFMLKTYDRTYFTYGEIQGDVKRTCYMKHTRCSNNECLRAKDQNFDISIFVDIAHIKIFSSCCLRCIFNFQNHFINKKLKTKNNVRLT